MESNEEYVLRKLKNGLLNLTALAEQSKVSRRTLVTLKTNKEHKANHSTIETLANFIRKIGE